jgi:hypothetical protein
MPDNIRSPKRIAAEAFTDAAAAVARLAEIYERNVSFLRTAFEAYVRGEPLDARVRAAYPFVRITTSTHARLDSRLSYGFVSGPGMYETSVTRPDLFRGYFNEQIGLLMQNHGVPVEIGESDEPIPIHFAYRRDINIAASVPARDRPLRDLFDTPDLATIDDAIVNGTLPASPRQPLAMFRAARVDYSLHRLYHYTGTDPEHFQNFVIFTNYQFYVNAFTRICRDWELGDHVATIRRLSQSRAIALDMESAAVAANGFRFRVPYGTLLCVSDKPLHGEIKLAGMAGDFYRRRVGQHLEIGLRAMEKLKSQERERLHSRKLRSFAEVAFQ